MTDHQFLVELRIRAYVDQIGGYPLGHPARENFKPIVPTMGQNPLNRERTLDLPCYHNFSAEDRAILLQRAENPVQRETIKTSDQS